MDYNVLLTENAEADLDSFISYILYDNQNPQAALNILEDFDNTIETLSRIAGNLKLCNNPQLRKLGYRRINFFLIDILCYIE